jgi:hypothetical protein
LFPLIIIHHRRYLNNSLWLSTVWLIEVEAAVVDAVVVVVAVVAPKVKAAASREVLAVVAVKGVAVAIKAEVLVEAVAAATEAEADTKKAGIAVEEASEAVEAEAIVVGVEVEEEVVTTAHQSSGEQSLFTVCRVRYAWKLTTPQARHSNPPAGAPGHGTGGRLHQEPGRYICLPVDPTACQPLGQLVKHLSCPSSFRPRRARGCPLGQLLQAGS